MYKRQHRHGRLDRRVAAGVAGRQRGQWQHGRQRDADDDGQQRLHRRRLRQWRPGAERGRRRRGRRRGIGHGPQRQYRCQCVDLDGAGRHRKLGRRWRACQPDHRFGQLRDHEWRRRARRAGAIHRRRGRRVAGRPGGPGSPGDRRGQHHGLQRFRGSRPRRRGRRQWRRDRPEQRRQYHHLWRRCGRPAGAEHRRLRRPGRRGGRQQRHDLSAAFGERFRNHLSIPRIRGRNGRGGRQWRRHRQQQRARRPGRIHPDLRRLCGRGGGAIHRRGRRRGRRFHGVVQPLHVQCDAGGRRPRRQRRLGRRHHGRAE
ncbi:hypothetical protein D9M68_567580 [compost metagenome]